MRTLGFFPGKGKLFVNCIVFKLAKHAPLCCKLSVWVCFPVKWVSSAGDVQCLLGWCHTEGWKKIKQASIAISIQVANYRIKGRVTFNWVIRAKLQEVLLAKIEGWVVFENRKMTRGSSRWRDTLSRGRGELRACGQSYALELNPMCREVLRRKGKQENCAWYFQVLRFISRSYTYSNMV